MATTDTIIEEGISGNHSNVNFYNIHSGVQDLVMLNPHLFLSTPIEDLLYGIILPVLVVVSILANLTISLVLTLSKTNGGKFSSLALDRLLQCLSCYDICVSVMSLSIYSIPIWFSGSTFLMETFPTLLPYLIPVLHMAITGSDYLNLAAAVERYLATDRYFRNNRRSYHQGCTPKRANLFIVLILGFTVCFNIPSFWELRAARTDNFQPSHGNITIDLLSVSEGDSVIEIQTTELRENDVYNKMYRLMAEFLIFKFSPWMSFLVLFLTMKHRIGFYQRRKIQRTMTDLQILEIQDSRIVLGIIVLFYLTNILPVYISFCHILLFEVENIIILASKLSLVSNSTFKLLIYLLCSPGFRQRFLQLFLRKKTSTSKSDGIESGVTTESLPLKKVSVGK